MRLVLPRLYVILDASLLTAPDTECAKKLADAGVRLLQYRNKFAPSRELFESSRRLSSLLIPRGVTFVVNDRADFPRPPGARGVTIGKEGLGGERRRQGPGGGRVVGVRLTTLGNS